jgi:hypothetical protein
MDSLESFYIGTPDQTTAGDHACGAPHIPSLRLAKKDTSRAMWLPQSLCHGNLIDIQLFAHVRSSTMCNFAKRRW